MKAATPELESGRCHRLVQAREVPAYSPCEPAANPALTIGSCIRQATRHGACTYGDALHPTRAAQGLTPSTFYSTVVATPSQEGNENEQDEGEEAW